MNDPIRVLHPITRLIVGGAQENTLYTAELLDQDRFQVEVVSGPQTGSEGSLIPTAEEKSIRLEILPEMVREINPWKDVRTLWKLYRQIKSRGYTIVHTHSSKAGILGRLAAWFAQVPIILHTVHGWSFHDRMNASRRWLFIQLERWFARFSDGLVVVAQKDIEKGLSAGIGVESKYHLIRSAIPLDEFNPGDYDRDAIRREIGIPVEVPILGNVGRLSPQKNPVDWVRIAAKISKELPTCWFLLVGDGPLREEVVQQLETSGIADRTILTGLRRDVPRLMAVMDVFLLTSLWEGLPRVIPQAMAMEVPVVANRADGTVEAIDHEVSGYICEPNDIQGAAKYCLTLLQDSRLRQQMGRCGRKNAIREFDLNQMVTNIELLYENLLKQKGL